MFAKKVSRLYRIQFSLEPLHFVGLRFMFLRENSGVNYHVVSFKKPPSSNLFLTFTPGVGFCTHYCPDLVFEEVGINSSKPVEGNSVHCQLLKRRSNQQDQIVKLQTTSWSSKEQTCWKHQARLKFTQHNQNIQQVNEAQGMVRKAKEKTPLLPDR